MDLLRVCREFRIKFPKPVSLSIIADSFYEYGISALESKTDFQDVCKALFSFWKKSGWILNEVYAIQLEEDEDAMFHDRGITIIKIADDLPSDKALLKLIPMGKTDEKVVWF